MNQSIPHCLFCRTSGHTVATCPEIDLTQLAIELERNPFARCELIAGALQRMGYDAYADFPYCVYVNDDRFKPEMWVFGMANDVWGGHRIEADGNAVADTYLDCSVDSDSHDPEDLHKVAAEIDRYLRNPINRTEA